MLLFYITAAVAINGITGIQFYSLHLFIHYQRTVISSFYIADVHFPSSCNQ